MENIVISDNFVSSGGNYFAFEADYITLDNVTVKNNGYSFTFTTDDYTGFTTSSQADSLFYFKLILNSVDET